MANLGKMSGAGTNGSKAGHQLSQGKAIKNPVPGQKQFVQDHSLQHAPYSKLCGTGMPGKKS